MWTNRRPILMSINLIKKQRILFLEFCFLGNLTTFQIPIDILKKVTHAFFKFLKIRDPAGSHYKHVLILQVNIGDGIP